ncbi:MAG: penicillin-binding protein 2 [Candidatus Omnitrophica bacterium]|nr:penicillin-binding protein 2 [Candidatus Omnitrophota bacterium]
MRIKIIRLIITFLFLVIAVDLFYVQVIRGKYYYGLSVNNRIRVVPLEGQRGRIFDRNMKILVDNRLSLNVAVIPQDMKEGEMLFDYLSRVLKVKKQKLLRRFYQKKVTPFAPVVVAEDVDKRVAMVLEENRFRFPGLYIQESVRREYPFKEVGSHVLGYVGKINRAKIKKLKDYGYTPQSVVGYSGVEESYDSFMKGKEGGAQIEVNNRGQQVKMLSVKEPEKGQDIQLTIDHRVQQIAAKALGEKHGTIIVMSLNTGEIRGMVSSPSYNPNIFVDSRLKKKSGLVFIDPGAPLLNRAIKGLYPPGSVFKVVMSTAALITGKIESTTTFSCSGVYRLGRRGFRCAHVHGVQDLVKAIAHSCNVYFFNAGLILGPDTIYKYAHLLGLGEETRIDLPYEEKGLLPNRAQRRKKYNLGWYKGDTLNYSIGQGDVLTTPLQLVRMMATVALRGREVQPHLIKGIGGKDVVQFSLVKRTGIKEEVFDVIQKGLRLVVADEGGTARLLNMKGFEVAGKTGTAQTTKSRPHHAWFVGYDLSGKEPIAFCVFLEYGGSSYHSCVVARDFLKELRKEKII